jgi:hypothetical protein
MSEKEIRIKRVALINELVELKKLTKTFPEHTFEGLELLEKRITDETNRLNECQPLRYLYKKLFELQLHEKYMADIKGDTFDPLRQENKRAQQDALSGIAAAKEKLLASKENSARFYPLADYNSLAASKRLPRISKVTLEGYDDDDGWAAYENACHTLIQKMNVGDLVYEYSSYESRQEYGVGIVLENENGVKYTSGGDGGFECHDELDVDHTLALIELDVFWHNSTYSSPDSAKPGYVYPSTFPKKGFSHCGWYYWTDICKDEEGIISELY